MKILLISPYHSGSHRAWAEGVAQHSQHDVYLLTLPGRFWKWRMHGGAVTLARRFLEQNWQPDLIIADDMLDLTTFLALTRHKTANIPVALYMHENQLTYPLPADGATGPMRRQHGERDRHYAFINYASMLTANHIFFNSRYHLNSWFEALPKFLNHFPEFKELGSIERLREKSVDLPVGINLSSERRSPISNRSTEHSRRSLQSPLILWNQRWEYDKNPEAFFEALFAIDSMGLDFRVAICGENFSRKPTIFEEGIRRLGDKVVHSGFSEREEYEQILNSAEIVISTAHHEFFGISIVEAIAHHAFPVLPNRLSYPELLPTHLHATCLYQSQSDLIIRLQQTLTNPPSNTIRSELASHVQQFNWQNLIGRYDQCFSKIVDISTKTI